MIKTCVGCKKKFEITKSEEEFYLSRGLSLPKRCKECREKKKEASNRKKAAEKHRLFRTLLTLFSEAVCLVSAFVFFKAENYTYFYCAAFAGAFIFLIYMLVSKSKKAAVSEVELYAVMNKFKYRFKNADDFREHFLKHGAETSSRTPKEYIKKANRVIKSPHSLKKREKEDGDLVFFDRATGEIVFCTPGGVIRSYYISDSAYFDRQ